MMMGKAYTNLSWLAAVRGCIVELRWRLALAADNG